MNGPSGSGPKAAADLPVHAGESTFTPHDANVRFTTDASDRLSESDWSALSNDLAQAVNASLGARGPLEANLKDWSDAYDMIVGQKDFPFEDSSNLTLPYIPSQLESLVAYIAGTVIVPRLYIVSGNTQEAAATAFQVEKLYNSELVRQRSDGSSYFSRHVDWLHLSFRDGTCVLETLWNRRRQRKRSVGWAPKLDPQTQLPMVDANGAPQWEQQVQEVDVYVKDYAELTPVPLKDFILIPDEARSIEEAAGVGRVEWLYEDQLDRMVRAGLLDSDEVERALSTVTAGTSDVAGDRQGTYDKDASQQIGVGQGQGSMTSEFFKNRGPIKVWRIHSRQFDMNKDGVPEENIFWYHEQTQRMLGWMPYDYASGQRPFFAFSPFPRPDRFYGFSLVERLAGIQAEMDATHNARNDKMALTVAPPLGIPTGSSAVLKAGQWKPGAILEVDFEGGAPLIKEFQLSQAPIGSFQEEALLKQYGNEYTGLNNPMMGGQSAGRRSATEMRQQNSASGTRLALISQRFRIAAGQVINFVHQLNKQYLRDDPQTMVDNQVFTLPLDVLAQDYTIGIAGASDPIDSTTRRNETMSLFDLVMKVPMVASNPQRIFFWLRKIVEQFGLGAEIDQLVGTQQDVQQFMQQQAAAQQAAAAQHGQPQQQQQAQH